MKTINLKSSIQWIVAFAVFTLLMQVGIQIGWSSPNIARLTANDSTIFERPLTKDEASWLASLSGLSGVCGSVLASISVELLGSRRTVLLAFVGYSISWACMIAARSVFWLYVARVIGGLMTAATYGSFSLYLGEMALPRIRGTLISLAAGGNPFGIVLGTIAETYLPMRVSSAIYLTQALLAILFLAWLMDTPHYLVKRRKFVQARKSIALYYVGCDVEKELQDVKNFIESKATDNFRDKLRNFNTPAVRKSMFLIIVVFMMPHLSGTMVLSAYMEKIMDMGKSHLIEPQVFVIYANITSVLSTLLTFVLIDKLGRRFLLVVTSLGTATGMIGLGLHFYLLNNGANPEDLQWLPVGSILVYLISYAVGYSPVPSTILGEIFTDNVKSVAGLVASLPASFVSFVIVKSYQAIVDSLGYSFAFWMYASFSLLTIPYVVFFLPETKGKTFQEIQDSLIK